MEQRTYLCIDLKSFYASVECVERKLDPLTTNLVVADPTRTEKTICLAVSPSLKALGVPSRCRVFEIPKGIDFITAPPRMQLYIDYAANVYAIYLNYVSPEDIHVYSIDEAFLDVTHYLPLYLATPRELARRIMGEILERTGITATCGIGTNLYLAKVALDITAKHIAPEPGGARIAELDEEGYRRTLWDHQPITDFWRIGRGISARLARLGLHTMGQVAAAPEEVLYRAFGVDAELLIDHAWGWEPTTIADIKAFSPRTSSLSRGQVLPRGYQAEEGRLVVLEMAESLSLELVEQRLAADSLTLHLNYSSASGASPAHGSLSTGAPTSSTRRLTACAADLYDRIANRRELLRRITLVFNRVEPEGCLQYDLFSSPEALDRERSIQEVLLEIRKKYGRNAILKGADLQKGATARERNEQIGGHRA